MTYNLSAPLLYDFDAIDRYVEYNKKYSKSQITLLFNSIPWPQSEKYNEWFMSHRFGISNPALQTYEDFDKYVQYAFSKGFDFVYLMNSPKVFNERDIEPFKDDFYKLLDNLWNSGIRKIKFSNTQVAQLIYEYNPKFQLSVATILEYRSIAQYQALLKCFPTINHICVPKDLNQNFKFLQALKENFPNIEFELMVGEDCPKDCPTRFSCQGSSYTSQYKLGCKLACIDPVTSRIRNGAIHPWQLERYASFGFNNFKLLTGGARAIDTDTSNVQLYMESIENGVTEEYLMIYCAFLAHVLPKEACIALLPDIEYFVKNGHKCSYDCGTNCKYCFSCIENLKRTLDQFSLS